MTTLRRSTLFLVLMVMAALHSLPIFSQGGQSVGGYQLVSEVRVTRTVSRFTYRAVLTNSGPALSGATATATSLSAATTIVDDTLTFGPTGQGGSSVSTDTFSFNQDRTVPFDWANIRWSIASQPANTRPVVSAGSDVSITLPSAADLAGSASDDGLPAPATLTTTWTRESGPGVVVFGDPSAVATTATFGQPGQYVLRLTANDGELSAFDELTVDVTAANERPVASAGANQTAAVRSLVTLDGSGSSDANGDRLTYAWSFVSRPAGSVAALSVPTAVGPTFTIDRPGTYVLRLVVNDGTLDSVPSNVTISTINSPPAANAGPDQSAAVGAGITLDGSASSDVDGDLLTFAWSFVSRPPTSTAVLSNPTSVSPAFTIDTSGTYVIGLIVNDGALSSVADTVTVTTLNSRPVANAGPDQTAFVGNLVTLNGSGSTDVDGNSLTYTWSLLSVPTGSTAVLTNPTALSPTFVIDRPGTYVAQLIVHDGFIASLPDTVTITTQNSAPIADAGPDRSAIAGALVLLDGGGSSDVDGDALTFDWALTVRPAGSTAALAGANTRRPSFTVDLPGNYVVQLIVNDGSVSSAPDTITISTTNSAPIANAGADRTGVPTDSPVSLDGSLSSDPDGHSLTYFWSFTARPAGSTSILVNVDTATPTFTPDLPGDYVAQLIVNDGFVNSAPDTVSISARARVPDVVGQTRAQAESTLNARRLILGAVSLAFSDTVPSGSVISQSPTAGTLVDGGSAVDLVVSRGPSPVVVPNVVGLLAGDAATAITDARLVLGNSTSENSETVPAGRVIRQSPAAGSDAQPGSAVDIVVSLGPSVPVLTAITVTPANQTLTSGGTLQYAATGLFSDSHTEDLTTSVTWQSSNLPAANITPGGLATALEAGPTQIRAVRGSITGSTNLTVVAASLVRIVVTPANPALLTGQSQSFTATGVLTDGTSVNLAGQVTWASTAPAVAGINPSTGIASALTAGPTTISATKDGLTGSTLLRVEAQEGSSTAPVAAITAPAENAQITTAVNVVGTASDSNILKYVLEVTPAGTSSFTEIASGTASVVNGTLGTFDPTLLLNGLYELRLSVLDRSGTTSRASVVVQADGQQKVGNFRLSFLDVTVPVAGIPISINRVYDSREKRTGEFGVGWSLDVQSLRPSRDRVLGNDWQQTRSGTFLPTYCIAATRPHIVSVAFPDGRVEKFQATTSPQCQQIAPIQQVTVSYTPVAPTTGSLVPLDASDAFVVGGAPGPVQLLSDLLDPIDPQLFRYTSRDGRVFVLHTTTGVQSITDTNGNRVTFSSTGITHSAGKSITFTRDAQGRITQITAPGPETHRYEYDGNGNLARYIDPAGNASRYLYNLSHGLLEVRDPRGIRPIRNEYDDTGRLVASIDALGNRVTYSHDPGTRREIVTDRLGRIRVLDYDTAGNVTRETHPDGTFTARTFDTRNNVLTETDPLGGIVTRTYNAADDVLTRRNQLGNLVETFTYNSMGDVLTRTDGRGNVTTHTYDADGNRLSLTDGEGNRTSWTYDAQGNVLTMTDPRGGVTTNVYDSAGNLTRTTNPVGAITSYTYDAAGRRLTETKTRTVGGVSQSLVTTFTYDVLGQLTRTTRPDGSTLQNEYDAVGNLTATIDPLGRRTTYEYDALNRRILTTFADGTTERTLYDAEGQLVGKVDRRGLTTGISYDVRGRVRRITSPDGTFVERLYDAAGRLTSELNENGFGTTREFNAAGQLTRELDALGRETIRTYDLAGNLASERNRASNLTQFEYDRRNLLTRKVLPDGTFERYVYDQAGQPTSSFDQSGRETRLAYDLAQRVTGVTDGAGASWTFTYDEVGNRTAQNDPLGHTTQFEYDALGRETRRTLPLGLSQTRAYDLAGNLTSRTDFGGAVIGYEYDTLNRLTRRLVQGTTVAQFTYTPTGNRATAVDARGVTTYTYDNRDRFARVVQPDGNSLEYTYDAASNLTRRTATIGGVPFSHDFTYSRADQILTVTDSQTRVFTFTYTPTGKPASLAYPNGLTTDYAYNLVDRLTGVTTRNGGATVQSFTYTLGAAGQRLRVDEASGASSAYTYDAAGRLTQEIATGAGGPLFTDAFTYDAAGNRTRIDHTPAGGALSTRAITYDARDRMLTDGATTFTWDADGRLLTRSGGDGLLNVWDAEGRLRMTTASDGSSARHEYDVDGNRVRTTNVDAGGALTSTGYLVDTNRPLSHVVAETNDTGALTAEYVRAGDQLVAVNRPTGTRFYHADGLGSIRALTNAAGLITDAYTYDAFGTLTNHTGTDPNPYLFTGESISAGGLYHLRARWMDPSGGRFLSMDPADGVAERPRTLNRYAYVGSDPVNFTDPSGEFEFSIAGLSVSINIQGNLRTSQGAASQAALQRIRQQLARLTIDSVKSLQRIRQAGQQTHHLIEQRLWRSNPALRQIFRSVDDMPGVNLSAAEHQVYTNLWRQYLPYSNQVGHIANPTLETIMEAATHVYADAPHLLKAIMLALL